MRSHLKVIWSCMSVKFEKRVNMRDRTAVDQHDVTTISFSKLNNSIFKMFWSRKDVFRYWKYLIFGVSYLIFRLKRKHWMWRESAHTWKLLKGCWSAEEHIQKWRSPGGLEGRRKCNGMLRLFWTQSYQFSRESCQSWSTCRPNPSQQLVKYCRCISLITPILFLILNIHNKVPMINVSDTLFI